MIKKLHNIKLTLHDTVSSFSERQRYFKCSCKKKCILNCSTYFKCKLKCNLRSHDSINYLNELALLNLNILNNYNIY